jgi:hypothetical protein
MNQTRSLEFGFAMGLDGKLAIAHAYLGLMKVLLGRADNRAHVEGSDATQSARASPLPMALLQWSRRCLSRASGCGIESLRKTV